MSLATAITRAESFARLPPRGLAASRLAKVVKEMSGEENGSAPPPPETLDEVVLRVRAAVVQGRADQVGGRDWRRLPWALWREPDPLALDRPVLDALEWRLRERRRRGELRSLIAVYLRDFAPERPELARIAALLAELVPNGSWVWRERHEQLRLFDPAGAPGRLLDHCARHPAGPRQALAGAGLATAPHLGLAYAAYLEGLQRLRARLAAGRADHGLEPMLAWAQEREGRPLGHAPLANALLLPWCTRTPPAALQERIQVFLLRHYGDPRVKRQSWIGVDPEAEAVFRRWLVKVALDQFLEVIDKFAYERHWSFRRAFWMAYFDAGGIDEAHVMFGTQGYAMARRLFGSDVPCARLEADGGKPVEAGHAVLLLRIGRLVVADWSHNGQCVIWRESHPRRPGFDQSRYTSSDVDWRHADFRTYHAGADNYHWQRKVRDHIHQHTGINILDHAFRVR